MLCRGQKLGALVPVVSPQKLQAKTIYREHDGVVEVSTGRACMSQQRQTTHTHFDLSLLELSTAKDACVPCACWYLVQDVAWHCHHKDIFGSVGDDKHLILWDTRRPPNQGIHTRAHTHTHTACSQPSSQPDAAQ